MSNDYVPPLGQRLGASLSVFFLNTIGSVIYVVVIIALIRGRKKIPNHTFYVFVYNFAVADMGLNVIARYFVAVPLSFTGRPSYGTGLFFRIMSFSNSFFYNAIVFLSFVVSLHRFLVFFSPKLSQLLFDRPKIYFILIIPWISGFLVDGAWYFIGDCFKTYNYVTFNFMYDCSANTTSAGLVMRQFPLAGDVLPPISLVLYIIVYFKMRRDRQAVIPSHLRATEMEKIRRERSFLIQALIICLSIWFEILLFHLASSLTQQNAIDGYWVSLLLGWVNIVMASVNPIIYVIFNQTIKEIVFELLGVKKTRSIAQTTTNVVSILQNNRTSEPTIRTPRKISTISVHF